jgi:Mor family transcriptional regulator
MTTIQLRKRVLAIVEHADDRLLKMVYALMTEYESSGYEFSVEEKGETYRRSKDLKSGKVKGLSLEETIKKAKNSTKK